MSDTEHEVKVIVSADVREFQASMKQARGTVDQLEKQQGRMKKANVKEHKSLGSLQKDIQKHAKREGNVAIQHEKKLKAAIAQTTIAARKKLDATKGNVAAIQQEVAALKKLESQLANVQKYRKAMGIRTWGEKASSAGQRAGAVGRRGLNIAGGAAIGVAGGLLGMMIGQVGSSYAAAMQAGAAQGGLVGLGTRRDLGSPGRGQRFGYDIATTYGQAQQAGHATGNIGSVNTLQAAQRLGLEGATGYMASIRQGGSKFTGGAKGQGEQEFAKIIALGMESGIERSRLAENIGGVISLLDRQRSVSAGDVSGVGLSAFAALLGRSGLSGFQGAAGASLMSKLDSGIRNPGGGDAGQGLILQSMGFGRPGGGTGYYDALRMQEKGLSDPNNFTKVMGEMTGQFGRGQERNLAMKSVFGTSLDQSEELSKMFDSGKMGEAELKRLQQIAAESKSVEERGLDAMKEGFGGTIKHIAGLQNRLVGLGNQIKQPIEQMQKDFNDAVKDMWPAVVASLKTIANAVSWMKEFLETKFPDTGKAVNEAREKLAKAAERANTTRGAAGVFAQGDLLKQAQSARRAYDFSWEDLGKATQRGEGSGVWNLLQQSVGQIGMALGDSRGTQRDAFSAQAAAIQNQRSERARAMRSNAAFLRDSGVLNQGQYRSAVQTTSAVEQGTLQDTPQNRQIVDLLDQDRTELRRSIDRLVNLLSVSNNAATRGNASATAGPAPGRTGRTGR